MLAADTREIAVMQRVIYDIVLTDIVPDILGRPAGDRIELDETELIVVFDFFGICTGWRLIPADSCNPGIILRQNPGKRLYLADRAALVGIGVP
ncbi:hypothetical protein D3C81_1964880 [compost metagenome]